MQKSEEIRTAYLTICIFILIISMLWLLKGIILNSDYHKVTAVVKWINQISSEDSYYYKDGKEVPLSVVTYSYKIDGTSFQGSFEYYENYYETYSVGDTLVFYHIDGWANDKLIKKDIALTDMLKRMFFPSLFFLISLVLIIKNRLSLKIYFYNMTNTFRKSAIYSICAFLLDLGFTVYVLFLYKDTSFFAGLGEFVYNLFCLFICFISLIIAIIVWAIANRNYNR